MDFNKFKGECFMSTVVDKTRNILEEYDSKKSLYSHFLNEIEHQVKSILQTSGISVNAITSRLKDKDSLKGKIDRKDGKYENISNITDIVGIRIITYFSEDVDRIAEIIESEFDVDKENSIDKRESLEPDRFGYCSVHYVVKMSHQRLKLRECAAFKGLKCEIQIRSILQHAWAEIEHDIGYKSEITVPKEMRRNFSRIAGLLEIADKEFVEIRTALAQYRKDVEDKISTQELFDRELDAVILGTLITQNPNILRINKHIQELVRIEFVAMDDSSAQRIIQYLKWFNITNVSQLSQAIVKYTDAAIAIASEMLKTFKPDDNTTIKTTISFFYLCYAILLSEHCKVEEIEKYLIDEHIGRGSSKTESANELYQLGIKLGLSQK